MQSLELYYNAIFLRLCKAVEIKIHLVHSAEILLDKGTIREL